MGRIKKNLSTTFGCPAAPSTRPCTSLAGSLADPAVELAAAVAGGGARGGWRSFHDRITPPSTTGGSLTSARRGAPQEAA
jgi:hypothetical protein